MPATIKEGMNKKLLIKHFLKDESGQALIEYILLAVVSLSVVATLKTLITELTVKIWRVLAKRIAAPCPVVENCDPGDDFNI